jgi:hypothetical protein
VTKTPWRLVTRRSFVAMLGAAVATLALRKPREPKPTVWIGHF